MFYDCIQSVLLHGLTEKQPLADNYNAFQMESIIRVCQIGKEALD